MNLFDYAAAQEAAHARERAIDQVAGGADVRFIEMARDAVLQAAQTMPELTTDDIVPLCAMTASEGRAWGAIMRWASQQGIVAATDRYRASSSKVCHARKKQVWESLVCRN